MTLASLAILGGTIVISSFISGVFGMAGGMVLLGVLLIYFDVETKRQILGRVKNALAPDGYLFLGASEMMSGIDEAFRQVHATTFHGAWQAWQQRLRQQYGSG